MDIILRARVKMFILHADFATKQIVNSLLKEIQRVENSKLDLQRIYQKKYDEINHEKLYWENKFFDMFYGDPNP